MDYSLLYNHFCRGDSIYIPGSSAEPRGLVDALLKASNDLPDLTITHTFIPGINTVALATPENSINEVAFFPRPGELFDTDRILFHRDSWSGVYAYLQQQKFDWLVIHISPPNDEGEFSLGTSIEFLPLLLERSTNVIGIVNQQMPFLPNAPVITADSLALMFEINEPLVEMKTAASDPASIKIAEYLTLLIDQDSILQTGIGNIPDIFLGSLQDRRKLKFESGMLSDGFLALHDAGALDPDFNHRCTLTLGTAEFYRRLPEITNLSFVPVDQSHQNSAEESAPGFIAINSAVQVDCQGRANLEFIGKRRISNVGGALDFAMRANHGKNSKNVIAMPATAAGGKLSRIVGSLESAEHDSLNGTSVDYVVTEFGIADLVGKTNKARAQAMIDVAAPEFRQDLE